MRFHFFVVLNSTVGHTVIQQLSRAEIGGTVRHPPLRILSVVVLCRLGLPFLRCCVIPVCSRSLKSVPVPVCARRPLGVPLTHHGRWSSRSDVLVENCRFDVS